ncbi:ubiquitin-protein ligase E3B-like [Actinia tenebrosa]|uniref:Ubiquitin-protein ligase E3B n=1 Tax=Actinia tenebrosa TaxID=6105 RepID=A0A6P8IYH8_ACTTE|nr:ubiquitin-protein ligase E3B-like [Actinia tenebrosa]
MFAGSDNKKNESVVSKAQAARQQRAEERAKEKAALKIQAWTRRVVCVSKLRKQIREEFDAFLEEESSSSKTSAITVFHKIRRFLFIFQDKYDAKRLVSLCRIILSSMEQNNPKVWYISVALSQDLILLWIQQVKNILWHCCRLMRKLKPHIGNDSKEIIIYLNMLITLTDCSKWKILTAKGGDALKPSFQQLCSNILGFLNTKGFYPVLKDLLMNGLARSSPSLKVVPLTAATTLSLRSLVLSQFSENLCSLFILNILSVPGLVLHLSSIAPEMLKRFQSIMLFSKVIDFMKSEQRSRITYNSLECGYSLCLLANIVSLSQLGDEALKQNLRDFIVVVSRVLLYCQSYVAKKQSSLTNWHPLLGWFKQNTDQRLNDSIPHVTKQLQILWHRSTVQLLFEDLKAVTDLDKEAQSREQNRKDSKSLWSLFGSLQRGNRSSIKVSQSQVELVSNVCVMYQTMVTTFSLIRLDILTGLSYQEEFLVRLWRFFVLIGNNGGPELVLNSITRSGVNCSHALQSTLTLFFDCCGHLLPIVDDQEMYEQQKPFSLDDLVHMSTFLNKLVFKLYWNEITDENKPQSVSAETLLNSGHSLLMILYDRDCRRSFTPPNHWLIKEVKSNTFRAELAEGRRRACVILQKIPHVMPHIERVQLFRECVAKDKEVLGITRPNDDFVPQGTLITVRRNRLLEDGYDQLSKLSPKVLKGVIRVRFINEQGLPEAGIDQDGVFKEFLEETIKKAFDPGLNLFKTTTGDEQRLYPSSTSFVHDNHLNLFEFIGKMLGKAVYEGIVVEVPFASFFLNHVLGHQHSSMYSSIDELPSLDQELYKSLTFIKNYDGDIRDLDLSFAFEEDVLGKVVTHELKPGGSVIPVTNENKISYVHLMANYRMRLQHHNQTKSFIRGFKSIVRSDWLRMFSAPELQRLISGDNAALDLSDLRKHSRYYGGYHSGHRVVVWLWEILEKDFNDKEKSQFLKFVTSCSKPPLLGFEHLEPPFSVRCVECSDDEDDGDTVGSVIRGFLNIRRRREPVGRLPTASTCFNLLKLPNYHKKSTLKEKLRYSIQCNAGFELS